MGLAKSVIGTAACLLLVTQANAQSVRGFEHSGTGEVRAMVGISIPLGGKKNRTETKPRFDMRLQAAQISSDRNGFEAANPLYFDRQNVRETRLSFTFEDNPKFLLNGQSLNYSQQLYADQEEQDGDETSDGEDGDRKGRTTGEKILIGAGAAVGVVAVVAAVGIGAILLNCSDSDGCGE